MASYDCQGIIVFPHKKAIPVYMAKLRMVYGEELYEQACSALVTVRKFDMVGSQVFSIPMMAIHRMDDYIHHDDIKQLPLYRMAQAAEELDLCYKFYLQDRTFHNDHNIYSSYKLYGNPAPMLEAVGEDNPLNTMDESMIQTCIQSCVEDVAMEMRVWVGTEDGESWELSGDMFPYECTVKESITNVNKEESL